MEETFAAKCKISGPKTVFISRGSRKSPGTAGLDPHRVRQAPINGEPPVRRHGFRRLRPSRTESVTLAVSSVTQRMRMHRERNVIVITQKCTNNLPAAAPGRASKGLRRVSSS